MVEEEFKEYQLACIRQVSADHELSLLAKVSATVLVLKHMNLDTLDAWPAVETLARDVGRGKTQVQESLLALERHGHLHIEKTKGGKCVTNRYKPILKPPGNPEGMESKPTGNPEGNECKPSGFPEVKKGKPSGNPDCSGEQTLRDFGSNPPDFRTKPSGIPEGNLDTETNKETRETRGGDIYPAAQSDSGKSDAKNDPDFAAFWNTFPRKVSPGAARVAFEKARKVASLETILDGARRYASERLNEDPKYTKHPATWLNGECWLDEPKPVHVLPAGRDDGRPMTQFEREFLKSGLPQ
jgi:hypothetical protein